MRPRRLELDHFAAPRRSRWLGFVVFAASLVLAAEMTHRYAETQRALEREGLTQGLLNTQRPALSRASKEQVDQQVKNAEAVMRQLTLPWGELIERLEQASGKDIAILQLQPDAQQRLVRITAEARSQDAMVEYLRRLSAAKGFSYVHLVSHQVQQDDPQRPIQFAAQASFGSLP